MTLLIGSITIGLVLALLALGIFISFRIFDFPDITAEGSSTFGAAITASLIVAGTNPVMASILAFVGGLLAGSATGAGAAFAARFGRGLWRAGGAGRF